MTDLIDQICTELHIDRDIRSRREIALEDALPVLKRVCDSIQDAEKAAGFLLWHLDPTDAELGKIAEALDLPEDSLRSWLNTYSRLQDSHAMLRFSLQQQLARIQDPDERKAVFVQRPEHEWTLPLLKEAVEAWLYRNDEPPQQKRTGCGATFGGRKARATLTLTEGAVLIDVTASEDLGEPHVEKIDEGIYRIMFHW